MLKRYTFWLWMAIIFQSLTGAIHSISLFVDPVAQNETERQLIDLMKNYRQDAGAGFSPSMSNLFTALSSCFTLLCLLGGWTNAYLLRKKVATGILKGLLRIQLVIFGICFVLMFIFTFLPPVVLSGLVVLFLTTAYFCIPTETT